ncbi:MAG: hypothetical protein KGZ25_07635, partial [Planctomycetes bacterium]|nr:hypothetical protein [Planctomycetota bacterium]
MRDRLSSWFPALLSLVVLFPPLRAADNARTLQVSFHQTGPEKVQTAPDGFIAGLDARDRFTARCSDVRTTAWDHPPEGVSHTRWVSLVMVGFRTRRNWLAFMFDGPNGGISLVVHRPACTIQPDGVRTFASPPGRQQFSENAVKELAADFAHAFPGVLENEP